jgi:hypothetical protein
LVLSNKDDTGENHHQFITDNSYRHHQKKNGMAEEDNTPDHQGFSTIYGIKLFFTEENHRQFIRDWKVSF